MQLENYLLGVLKKLEESSQKVLETSGYTKEIAKVKALEALIKEQLHNENTRRSARPTR